MTARPPLVVDMDGALLRSDVLFESFAGALGRRPIAALASLLILPRGRAHFKRQLAELGQINIDLLPLREDFVAYLASERAAGRRLHLATASDHQLAVAIAARVGLFDSVQGSLDGHNLKGHHKRDRLLELFPEGFSYAGDSHADLHIWKASASIVLAGAGPGVSRKAEGLGPPIEARFHPSVPSLFTWLAAMRLHQWSKNLLAFAPLFLTGRYLEAQTWLFALAAFLLLGVAASGTYILNDLSDLAADRAHRSKQRRPFAASLIPVAHGLVGAPIMILGALGLALALSPTLALALLAYLTLTLAYSLGFKRMAILDVVILGALYTLRIVVGAAAITTANSAWLLAFTFILFTSLSLAKRHVELVGADQTSNAMVSGRGYTVADAPLTMTFGVSMAIASALVMVLYLVEEAFPSELYRSSQWLWAAPALLLLWVMRIWFLAHRGVLDDDPVAYALRDATSWGLGLLLALAFGLAVV